MLRFATKRAAGPAKQRDSMPFPKLKSGHWVLIVIALLVTLDWAIRRPDGQTRQLNDVLASQGSPELQNYPYRFQVLRVEKGMAVLSTPRNVEVPALRALGVLHPEVNVKDPNNPAFIAIEKELARVQSEAAELVRAQPGIKGVRWELDRQWLRRQGIEVIER